MKNKAEFKLWISQFDSDVINSYPQKVVSVKNKFFFREVVIQNVSTHEDFEFFDFPKEFFLYATISRSFILLLYFLLFFLAVFFRTAMPSISSIYLIYFGSFSLKLFKASPF